jgi:hypothetical protein
MSQHIIDPRAEQIKMITSMIGEATMDIMNREGLTAFDFGILFWQRQQPIERGRLLMTVPPRANLEEFDEVLGVTRTLLQEFRSSRQ